MKVKARLIFLLHKMAIFTIAMRELSEGINHLSSQGPELRILLPILSQLKRKNFNVDKTKWTFLAQICISGMFLRPWRYSLPRKIEEQAQVPDDIG